MTIEEALVAVWRGALVDGAAEVELGGRRFAVRETPRKRLREVDFVFEGQAPRKSVLETRKQKLEMGKPQERALQRSLNDASGKIVLRGIEQNPEAESRWAQLAKAGHKVMQFLSAGRYIGNVVDGKVTIYGGRKKTGTMTRGLDVPAELPKDMAREEHKKDKPRKSKRR